MGIQCGTPGSVHTQPVPWGSSHQIHTPAPSTRNTTHGKRCELACHNYNQRRGKPPSSPPPDWLQRGRCDHGVCGGELGGAQRIRGKKVVVRGRPPPQPQQRQLRADDDDWTDLTTTTTTTERARSASFRGRIINAILPAAAILYIHTYVRV